MVHAHSALNVLCLCCISNKTKQNKKSELGPAQPQPVLVCLSKTGPYHYTRAAGWAG